MKITETPTIEVPTELCCGLIHSYELASREHHTEKILIDLENGIGILKPLGVYDAGADARVDRLLSLLGLSGKRYMILTGHHRWSAAVKFGLKMLPVKVLPPQLDYILTCLKLQYYRKHKRFPDEPYDGRYKTVGT